MEHIYERPYPNLITLIKSAIDTKLELNVMDYNAFKDEYLNTNNLDDKICRDKASEQIDRYTAILWRLEYDCLTVNDLSTLF